MQTFLNERKILTVSDLNKSVKRLLETNFPILWIEGEISNLSKPQSGHIYFTLKDEQAQVRCALFRMRNTAVPIDLQNGLKIVARGKLSLYADRGDYQLIIDQVEELGEGMLRRQFEMLKQKLAAEGLFDANRKRPIPRLPRCIGVVTSPTGAAIKDVLSVLRRRFISIPIIIYPTAVQGEQASTQIAATIKLANKRRECDVLIICRGGGSLEDLWSFNEEVVARALFESDLPTISAVGHEIDFTICDFVADCRAPTPSAAAELLSPDRNEHFQSYLHLVARMINYITADLKRRKMLVKSYQIRFSQPQAIVQQRIQTLDMLQQQLLKATQNKFEVEKNKLMLVEIKLHNVNPIQKLKESRDSLVNQTKLLQFMIQQKIQNSQHQLSNVSRALNTISPLNTLERGYSITTKKGHVVEDVQQLSAGDQINVRLRNGLINCCVEKIASAPTLPDDFNAS